MLGRENVFLGIKQLTKSSFGTGRARLGPQVNTFRHRLTILLYWASSLWAPGKTSFMHQLPRPSCCTGRAPFGPQVCISLGHFTLQRSVDSSIKNCTVALLVGRDKLQCLSDHIPDINQQHIKDVGQQSMRKTW